MLVLTIIIVLFLCGCNAGGNSDNNDSVSVILPDAETATNVNGYLINSASADGDNSEILYFANINSKKFHLSTCHWAGSIKPENLYKSSNRQLLISDGYEPCKTCKP